MRTTIAILDFTRMSGGRICFAGVDRQGHTIRPTFRGWLEEKSLFHQGRLIVYPFAVINIDLRPIELEPPHCEDRESNPWTIQWVKEVDPSSRQRLLEPTVFPCIADVFGAEIYDDLGHYVKRGEGERSIGTICPLHIDNLFYDGRNGRWRICLTDQAEMSYCLSITDRTWWAYHHQQHQAGYDITSIVGALRDALFSCEALYLRIGLSRNWREHPDRCFLQVNSVYAFPNYFSDPSFSTILLSDIH